MEGGIYAFISASFSTLLNKIRGIKRHEAPRIKNTGEKTIANER